MRENVRGSFKWMAGWLVGASLLGACGAPTDEAQADVAQGAQELAAGDVSVRLSAEKATLGASEKASVTITLTNDSRHPVKLLKWYTPADGLEEKLLEVTLNGEAVDFMGPHYKRPAASEKDFLTLAPGESLTRTVDLAEVYDLSRTGIYGIRFAVAPRQLHGNSAKAGGLLKSNDVTLWIEGRSSARASDGPVTALTGSISYTNCSSTQQPTVLQALNAASTMANDASGYLNTTTPSGTPRYTTWFGAFSSSGWNTAKSHFAAIKDAFDTKPITVDCKCKKQYYAYVYPNQPYTIYVCSAFWSAPMTGTDSKGGTLIHEMSHFTVVAGTDDHVYGQSGAKSLAISDPASALDNADSHEYFAENTPFLQ
ncbi:M35 family metallo-endopeptidase [Vitiosangium sp. GDMCC 1.1324]|uniref:M35 family metallo-endopeptidase n=1 Tax=Vitiosangium sp. (strain GDMCC 1.1324) TaxID=2138576 RepID=UPI000D3AE494|nr:M35 family metallo-endopeptidase [Vitiosangium sp. GDMCC 1.1324]PTL75854.1 peptidase M35 [Vitiosangium sp. GDMCC 1.1324]